MARILLSSLGIALLLAAPAFAGHCPQDSAAIERALPMSSLDAAEKAEIEAMRVRGMALHEAGNHRESEAILAEAMRRLGISR